MVVASGGSQLLRVIVTFEIPHENSAWVDARDIIALYKGSGPTQCDAKRSFLSCTSETPRRQLEWGYTSVQQTSEINGVLCVYVCAFIGCVCVCVWVHFSP